MSDIDDVRDWVGSQPDDTAVNAQLARFGGEDSTVERAALSILLRRKTDWGATEWGVDGDYREKSTDGYRALLADITRLRAIVGDDVSLAPPIVAGRLAGPGNLR